jgi:endogenous inhibitor of DNA gyrase (YacG/DUF329 family)
MAGAADPTVTLRPRRPCPICGKTSVRRFHPFCSRRCSDIDLERWLGGKYAIPSEEPEPENKKAEQDGPD